ncbi:MAG: recombinase family protein [Bryobacteraceae bacterium]
MPDRKRKVIGVLRVSTVTQDNERQAVDIAAAARIHNLEVERVIRLDGVSGTVMLRHPEVLQMQRDLARPDIHGVVISAVDRLIRPAELGDLAIFDIFQRTKKKIWTPSQVMDLSDMAGFLQTGIQGVFAGFERQMFLARAAAGKMVARKRGRHADGKCSLPEGVSFDKIGGKWRCTPEQAARIRKAYDMLLHGSSYREIGAALVGKGEKAYAATTVRRWVLNPIWSGIRRYEIPEKFDQEVVFEGGPVITPETYQAALPIIDGKHDHWRKSKNEIPSSFLCVGLLRCRCGKPCYTRRRSRNEGHDYYYCSSKFPGRGPKCGAPSARRVDVDRKLVDAIERYFREKFLLSSLVAGLKRHDSEAPEQERQNAKARLRLETRRKAILEEHRAALITLEECQEQIGDIDRKLAAHRPAAPRPPAIDTLKLAQGLYQRFRSFGKMEFKDQQKLLQRAVGEVVMATEGAVPYLTLKGGFLGEITYLDWQSGVNPYQRSR